MSLLIDIFKKSEKGNAFRTTDTPTKYKDQIAAYNAGSANTQSGDKITTNNVSKISTSFIASKNGSGQIPSA